jgi:hypothetical protein
VTLVRLVRNPRWLASSVLLLGLAWGVPAQGQGAPADAAVADRAPAETAPPKLPPYHHSVFSWEHHVSAETVGVGDDPQTRNPTYTMGLSAEPRYYLRDNPGRLLSVRLVGGLAREFTNSDSTTQRGEWAFQDTNLALVYGHRFLGPADTDGTLLELRPITLTLPTSKTSYDSGRYFAAGVLVGVNNIRPVLNDKVLSTLRLAVGYDRWFARATVPTSPSLNRVRLTPDGRSASGDQLAGSSLVRDQLTFSGRLRFDFGGDAVVWTTDVAFAPAWKYDLQDDVQLCGVVATGCTEVDVSEGDSRYQVATQFATEVSIKLVPSLSLDFGYGNAGNQLGPDGRYRSIFYSPAAEFLISLSFQPHELAPTTKPTAQGPFAPQHL